MSNDEIKSIVERFDSSAVLDYGFKDNEGDLIGKALAEATGAAGKPKLVSSIDELDDTAIVTYRGFSDIAFADQFTTGEYWCGQGIYGCGSYTAALKWDDVPINVITRAYTVLSKRGQQIPERMLRAVRKKQ